MCHCQVGVLCTHMFSTLHVLLSGCLGNKIFLSYSRVFYTGLMCQAVWFLVFLSSSILTLGTAVGTLHRSTVCMLGACGT